MQQLVLFQCLHVLFRHFHSSDKLCINLISFNVFSLTFISVKVIVVKYLLSLSGRTVQTYQHTSTNANNDIAHCVLDSTLAYKSSFVRDLKKAVAAWKTNISELEAFAHEMQDKIHKESCQEIVRLPLMLIGGHKGQRIMLLITDFGVWLISVLSFLLLISALSSKSVKYAVTQRNWLSTNAGFLLLY